MFLQSLVSSFYTVFSRYIEFGNCMSILKAFKNIAEETYNDSLYCYATDFTETSWRKELTVSYSKHNWCST